jgi:hypothetical protein
VDGPTGPTGPNGLGYYGLTSSTSTALGTGSKTFTTNLSDTQTAFAVGQRVRIAYTPNPTVDYMEGIITAFSGTSLTVLVDLSASTGTYSAWNFLTAGQQGATGPTGSAGPTGPTGAAPNATYTRTAFTATAGQTTFTVTYVVGFIEVFVNGVLLTGSEYTASNGTTVVLSTACSAGDIVETIAYNTINIAPTGPTGPTGSGPTGPTGPTGSPGTGGATGGGTDQIFYQNGQTVTTNYTISTNYNAGTFGPISIDSGVTVTIPSGSTWTVV